MQLALWRKASILDLQSKTAAKGMQLLRPRHKLSLQDTPSTDAHHRVLFSKTHNVSMFMGNHQAVKQALPSIEVIATSTPPQKGTVTAATASGTLQKGNPHVVQVISQEEAEALQQQGQLLLSETACGHMYGVTKAAVQAVQYQDKVSLS